MELIALQTKKLRNNWTRIQEENIGEIKKTLEEQNRQTMNKWKEGKDEEIMLLKQKIHKKRNIRIR